MLGGIPSPTDPIAVAVRKQALRQAMVARILALDPRQRRWQEAVVTERLPGLPGFAEARTVMLYASAFAEEIATASLLQLCLDLGKRLVCPRVDRGSRRLRLYRVDDLATDLIPSRLGIPEPRRDCPEVPPEQVDWLLAPGLAFDHRGFRLGRGGGYYDRLLPTLRPDTPRWALALDPQWVDHLPVEPHDQPLDGIVSPSRTVPF